VKCSYLSKGLEQAGDTGLRRQRRRGRLVWVVVLVGFETPYASAKEWESAGDWFSARHDSQYNKGQVVILVR
jgi:hypothetical protein